MKFTSTSLTTLALAALPLARANFWLSAGHITGFGGPVGEDGNHWVVTGGLGCNELNNAGMLADTGDVSGGRLGVRVEWTNGPDNGSFLGNRIPTVAEIHTQDFHYTWYTQQDELVDLNNNVVGHCRVDMGTDKQCDVTAGVTRYQSLLYCTL